MGKRVEVPVPEVVEYTATARIGGIRDEQTRPYYGGSKRDTYVPEAVFVGKGNSPDAAKIDLVGKLWAEVGLHNRRADIVRAQIEAVAPAVVVPAGTEVVGGYFGGG